LEKKREMIQYIIWGVLSATLNVGLFQILILGSVDYRIANLITIIVVKIFCYVTNKFFVFRTPYEGLKVLLKEMLAFIFARGVTSVLDYVGVLVLVELFKCQEMFSKCVMAVVVVVVNYLFSKFFVFKKKRA
jgi:putative flippase GtrA